MLALGAFGFVVGLTFLVKGAWPVTGFLGLEIFLLWLVFRISFRKQCARTYVRVTADDVLVRKVDGWGRERRARLAAGFARVEFGVACVERDRTAGAPNALRVAASSLAYPLGEYLTPQERESFARRLSEALRDARHERHGEGQA